MSFFFNVRSECSSAPVIDFWPLCATFTCIYFGEIPNAIKDYHEENF